MQFDIQGHRGCRGLLPENTIAAFIYAVKLGVTTLELDVVVSKDLKVAVSHEPWMNPLICSTPDGKAVTGTGMQYNLFQMDYAEIKLFDCGSRGHPKFPNQKKQASYKPLLSEMIDAVESYSQQNKLPEINYDIEIKCIPTGDNIYHPTPQLFSELLYQVLKEKNVLHRCNVQSFDYRTLKYFQQHYAEVTIAMLLEDGNIFENKLDELGFVPQIFSPFYKMVDDSLIEKCHQLKMKIIPWTVNDLADMIRLKNLGVDGLITDYPDVALAGLQ
jgi:glycerophosphoryl diester phosphodiesterase